MRSFKSAWTRRINDQESNFGMADPRVALPA
jgi:hypothetical protein